MDITGLRLQTNASFSGAGAVLTLYNSTIIIKINILKQINY